MSREIDERILQMRFDNQEFERNARDTMSTLEKLKMSFHMEETEKNFYALQNALNNFDLSKFIKGNLGAIAGFKLISKGIDDVTHAIERSVKAMSTDQIKAGWNKYAEKTKSVQTIMAATAKDFSDSHEQMKYVDAQMEKLNWFTDETSYNFTDMTSNIGKFTSAGVKLDDAVTAMEGIATWAGISGATISQASHAMYNLSQAMGVGAVTAIDWRSIENANMATKEFKESVIQTALEMGKLQQEADGTIHTLEGVDGDHIVSAENFRTALSDKWFTSDVLTTALHKYGDFTEKLYEYTTEIEDKTGKYLTTSKFIQYINDFADNTKDKSKVVQDAMDETGMSVERLTEMFETLNSPQYDLGKRALMASQEAKTWKEAFESVTDAVSTGWMKTFEYIFGNYEEAKKLWTTVANELYDVFAEGGNLRNDILKMWSTMRDDVERTGRDLLLGSFGNIWKNFTGLLSTIKSSIKAVFSGVEGEDEYTEKVATTLFNISKWLNDVTSSLVITKDTLEKVGSVIRIALTPLKVGFNILSTFAKSVFPAIASVGNEVLSIIGKAFNVLSPLTKYQRNLMNTLPYEKFAKVVSSVANVLARIINGALKFIGRIIDAASKAVAVFVEVFEQIESFPKAMFKGTLKFIATLLEELGNLFSEITGFKWISKIFKGISETITTASESIESLITNAKGMYKSVGGGFTGVIKSIGYVLKNSIRDIGSWLTEKTGLKVFENVTKNIPYHITKVQDKIFSFIENTKKKYEEFGGGFSGVLKMMLDYSANNSFNLFNWLADKTGIEWFRTLGTAVKVFFLSLQSKVDSFLAFIKPAIDKINGWLEPVKQTFKGVFGWFFEDDPAEEIAESVEESAKRMDVAYKSVAQMAMEYIRGDWGNGLERDQRSVAAGYNNDMVQDVVNHIWTLSGEFKEGWEEYLKNWEDVDARLEQEEKKHEKGPRLGAIEGIPKFLEDTAHAVYEDGKVLTESTRSIKDQIQDAKAKALEGLPGLIFNIGKAIAFVVVKAKELIDKVVTHIETHHTIDNIVAGIINFGNTVRELWPAIKTAFTNIIGALGKGISYVWKRFVAFKNLLLSVFSGTGAQFKTLVIDTLVGDWKQAGTDFIAFFEKVKNNFKAVYEKWVSDINKKHNPFATIIKGFLIAILAVRGGIKWITNFFTSFKTKSEEAGKSFIDSFINKVSEKYALLGSILTKIFGFFSKIGKAVKSFFGVFKNTFKGTSKMFEELEASLLLSDWETARAKIKEIFGQIKANLKEGFINLFFKEGSEGADEFSNKLKKLKATILKWLKDAARPFANFWSKNKDIIKEHAKSLLESAKVLGGRAWSKVKKVWNNLGTVFEKTKTDFGLAKELFAEGDFKAAGKQMVVTIKQAGTDASSAFKDWINQMAITHPLFGKFVNGFEKVKEKFLKVIESIRGFFERHSGEFAVFGQKIWESLQAGWSRISEWFAPATSTLQQAFAAASPLFDQFVTAVLTFDWSTAKDLIGQFFSTLGTEIVAGVEKAVEIGSSGLEKLGNFVGTLFGFIEDTFGAALGLEVEEENGPVASKLDKVTKKEKDETIKAIKGLDQAEEEISREVEVTQKKYSMQNIGTMVSDMVAEYKEKGALSPETKEQFSKVFSNVSGVLSGGVELYKDFRIAGLASSLAKTAGKMPGLIGGFTDVLSSMTDVLTTENLGKLIQLKYKKNTAESILDVVLSFALVVGAIAALGYLPDDTLSKGIEKAKEIGLLVIEFYGLIKGTDWLTSLGRKETEGPGETFKGIGWSLVGMAAAIGILYYAVEHFGELANTDPDKLEKGMNAVEEMLGWLGGILEILTATSGIVNRNKAGSIVQLNGVASSVFALGITIAILSHVVGVFGDMKFGELTQGMVAVEILLASFGTVLSIVMAVGSKGTGTVKAAMTILSIGIAIWLMIGPIKELANMDLWPLIKGVGALSVLMLALGGAVGIIGAAVAKTSFSKALGGVFLMASVVTGVIGVLWALHEFPFELGWADALTLSGLLTLIFGADGILGFLASKYVTWGGVGRNALLIAEGLGALVGVIEALTLIPDNMDTGKVKAVENMLLTVSGIVVTLATTDVIRDGIFKNTGLKQMMGVFLTDTAENVGILGETIGFVTAIITMMNSYSLTNTTWTEDKVKNLAQMLEVIGVIVGVLAGVNLADKTIFAVGTRIAGDGKGKNALFGTISRGIFGVVDEAAWIIETFKIVEHTIDLMNNYELKNISKWNTNKMNKLKEMLGVVKFIIGELAVISMADNTILALGQKISGNKGWNDAARTLEAGLTQVFDIQATFKIIESTINFFNEDKYDIKNPERWTDTKLSALKSMLGVVSLMITELAAISMADNTILALGQKISGNKGWNDAARTLEAGLTQVFDIQAAFKIIESTIFFFNEDKYDIKNPERWTDTKLSALKSMLGVVSLMLTELSAISMADNTILALGQKISGNKGWNDAARTLEAGLTQVFDIGGAFYIIGETISFFNEDKYDIKDPGRWDDTKLEALKKVLGVVSFMIGELAIISMAENTIFAVGQKISGNDIGADAARTGEVAVTQLLIIGETMAAIDQALYIMENHSIDASKWDTGKIQLLKDMMTIVIAVVKVLAGITMVENGIFAIVDKVRGDDSSPGERFEDSLTGLAINAGAILESLGMLDAVLMIMERHSISMFKWDKNKIGMVSDMMFMIVDVVEKFAAITVVGGILKDVTSNNDGLTGFLEDAGDSITSFLGILGVLAPVVGALGAVIWLMNKMPMNDSWTDTKIDAIARMMDVVTGAAEKLAAINKIGGILGGITGSGNSGFSGTEDLLDIVSDAKEGVKAGDKFKEIGLDLASTVGAMLPVIGTLVAALWAMNQFPIDDSWTPDKVDSVKGIVVALAACAVALAKIPVPDIAGWSGVAASFKSGVAIDALLLPILGLLEVFALIDGLLEGGGEWASAALKERYGEDFNIDFSLSGLVDRMLKPVKELITAIGTCVTEINTSLNTIEGMEPEKVQPMVDIFELVASMDDNSSKVSNVLTMFTGTNEWTTIASGLQTMVGALTGFIVDTEGHDFKNINKINSLLKYFITFVDIIIESHSYGLHNYLEDILGKYTTFVNSVGTLLDGANNVDLEKMQTLVAVIKEFKEFASVASGIQLSNIVGEETFLTSLGDLATYGTIGVIIENLTNEESLEQLKGALDTIKETMVGYVSEDSTDSTVFADISGAFSDLADGAVAGFADYFSTTGEDSKLTANLTKARGDFVTAVQAVFGTATNESDTSTARYRIASVFKNIAKKAVESLRDSFNGSDDRINTAISAAATNFKTLAMPLFEEAGKQIAIGLSVGIESGMGAVVKAATRMANVANDTFNHVSEINSPSMRFARSGMFIGLGLAQGINDSSSFVENAIKSVADIAAYAVDEAADPVITPVVDLSNVVRDASYVNGMFNGGIWTLNSGIDTAAAAQIGAVRATDYNPYPQPVDYNSTIAAIRSDIATLSNAINNMQVVMDSGALVGSIAAPMDAALGRRVVHKARRN